MNYIKNKIKKLLIANRGEIAFRIQQTCKALGIKTVAIYAPQDSTSSYLYHANEVYKIQLDGYKAYLAQDEIIKVAKQTNCQAIHPGYGFLSENAEFAQKVVDSGLIWIGPDPETIKFMGDKNLARETASKIGIPTIPGAKAKTPEQAIQAAHKIGFPLILKDPLGGGGKCAKRVNNKKELKDSLKNLLSEIKKFTGTSTVLLERYLEKARHVEIQIAGDGKNFIHLFERDCSLQRRYQKIIEETPCKFVSKQTLEKMYITALTLAKSVNYKNIGTVEFMVTPNQDFFFLEMNTRLQVEHSVTELTTGIDLVALQLEIAQKRILPLKQENITQRGHSIQCRIYSEDPTQNFIPCTGKILHLEIPRMPFLRVDHCLKTGIEISPFFDPMQAKVTAFGQNRKLVISYIKQALENFKIQGIKTNIAFLHSLISSSKFIQGNFHTQTLTKNFIKNICGKKTFNISQEPTEKEMGAIVSTILEVLQSQLQMRSLSKTQEKKSSLNLWKAQQWR